MKKLYTILTLVLIIFLSVTNISSQCYPDRHNTSWFNGWASCEQAESPNAHRAKGHWIMYDLKNTFDLGNTHLWNVNDPKHLDWGIREVIVDVSKDGINWDEAGTFDIPMGSGRSIYEGSSGPDLTGYTGQYILLTAKSNYGGSCVGLSEIRIEAKESSIVLGTKDLAQNECFRLVAYPNPFTDKVRVEVQAECLGEIQYQLIDVLGRVMDQGKYSLVIGNNNIPLQIRDITAGTYFLHVKQGNYRAQINLVKM